MNFPAQKNYEMIMKDMHLCFQATSITVEAFIHSKVCTTAWQENTSVCMILEFWEYFLSDLF